jgi:hypothetical protein
MADAQTFEAPKPARPGEGHHAGLHLPVLNIRAVRKILKKPRWIIELARIRP